MNPTTFTHLLCATPPDAVWFPRTRAAGRSQCFAVPLDSRVALVLGHQTLTLAPDTQKSNKNFQAALQQTQENIN